MKVSLPVDKRLAFLIEPQQLSFLEMPPRSGIYALEQKIFSSRPALIIGFINLQHYDGSKRALSSTYEAHSLQFCHFYGLHVMVIE